ncbi:helix-turn-helix domain-containing protein [Streptomyces cacaoi]|uniref:helix-turn-helix domain-containing protein n=1 Tax=Streptomyces cacaoi TaxID=1898 RepID=UPI0016591D04|nr:helix-turn-helix transcriptional regulator [Streptomyces cacaoi]
MGRRRPLPGHVRPEVRRLVERLRQLKDRSGLSNTALAAKTPYSASTWQRYLSAVTFPPWEAVEALATFAGTERELLVRLHVMWESAHEAWGLTHRAATTTATATEPRPDATTPGPRSAASSASSDSPDSPDSSEPGTDTGPGTGAEAANWPGSGAGSEAGSGAGAGSDAGAAPASGAGADSGAPAEASGGTGRVRALRWAVALVSLVLLACVPDASGRTTGRPVWPYSLPSPAAGPAAGDHARCRGTACAGRDPEDAGCRADQRAVGRYGIKAHRITVFHSAACSAVWGAVTPAEDVRGISLSAPGAGQLWEGSGAGRTAMAPAPDHLGSNVQVCAVIEGRHSCVDAGNRAWTD